MRLLKYLMVLTYMLGLPLFAAAPPKIADLFTDIKNTHIPAHVTLPPQALNGKFVSVNTKALKTDEIQISLPGQRAIRAINKKTKTHSNGSQIWRGEVVGKKNSSAIFSQYGNAVAGVIRVDGRVYKLLPVEDGINSIIEVSPHEPWPESKPMLPPVTNQPSTTSTPVMAGDQLPPSDDGSVIDVMVVYSTDTKNRLGGDNGINAYIATAIAESNQAYTNSEIYTQLNLVHTAEVGNSSGSTSTDLNQLTNTSDGILDEVHTLRDQYKADMVNYLVEVSGTCGIAWLNTNNIANADAYGFSVVVSGCAVGYYSFAHELGHNMGSAHDPDNADPDCGIYNYSCGYPDPSKAFRTVMSYNCEDPGCDRYPHFSNPNVFIDGLTTGTADMDNARSINNVRVAVSGWRTSQIGPEEYVEDAVVMFPSDDVEEYGGTIYTDFGYLSVGLTKVGLRFQDVNLPHGATLTSAYLQMAAGDPSGYDSSASTIVKIEGQASGNAEAFSTVNYDITNRARTSSNVTWDIPAWNTIDILHNSPDISNIMQEIIDRTDWYANNSMALIVNNSSTGNKRLAKAWETTNGGIKLHTEYTFDCIQSIALTDLQWSMISMACDPGNKTVSDLFSDLPSGEYDTTWALYERNATNETYRLLALNEVPVEGRGYWFYTEQSGITLSIKGKDNNGSDIPLISSAGGRLNLVGNPLDSTVDWADVLVVDGGGTPRSLTYANDNNLMSRTMYQWNGSAYQTYDGITSGAEGSLATFDSFWVKAYQSDISLRIPSGAAAADVASDIQSTALSLVDLENTSVLSDEEQDDPSKDDWFVRLTVESGSVKDPGNVLGQLHDSVDGQDIHDLEEKAPFGTSYLSIVFPHEDFEGGEWGFTTDFHALKNKKDHWTFVVKASANVTDGVLHWEGPKDILRKSVIIDKETGKRIKLKKVENYRFKIKNGEHKFIFKVK